MVTKPVGQVRPVEPAGGEVEHETLLVIDGGVGLGAIEDEAVSMAACPTRLLPSTNGWF
jgi:hypothetical protein